MGACEIANKLANNLIVKKILEEKYPDKNIALITNKFVEFWIKKFKKYPTTKDILKELGGMNI